MGSNGTRYSGPKACTYNTFAAADGAERDDSWLLGLVLGLGYNAVFFGLCSIPCCIENAKKKERKRWPKWRRGPRRTAPDHELRAAREAWAANACAAAATRAEGQADGRAGRHFGERWHRRERIPGVSRRGIVRAAGSGVYSLPSSSSAAVVLPSARGVCLRAPTRGANVGAEPRTAQHRLQNLHRRTCTVPVR